MADGGAPPMHIVAVAVGRLLGFIPMRANTFLLTYQSELQPDLVLQLEILYLFAPCHGTNVKIGVPENYDGIFPWYLTKVTKMNYMLYLTSVLLSISYGLFI